MGDEFTMVMAIAGPLFLAWGWHALKTKQVHPIVFTWSKENPLRGALTVQVFGRMVGGSGLLMLLALIASVISGDGSYMRQISKVAFALFITGWLAAGIIEFLLWVYERYPYDGTAEHDDEGERAESGKQKRKRNGRKLK